MDQPDREAEPQFSRPVRQIVMMFIVLALSAVGIFFALPRVLPVFLANPYLNGFIGIVFFIGLLACFYQIYQLIRSISWIGSFVGNRDEGVSAPQLLAPLSTLLRGRRAKMQISSGSARSILDSVGMRIDEEREITRYITNFLIFLGLLGTFYGLATTIPALVETIRSLAPQEGEGGIDVFSRLMSGLESQLGGMGVAFASSLLGLSGSLIVGLLELLVSHGQNRFYRELEEWLSSITRLGFTSGDSEAGGEQSMIVGVVDSMAEQMEDLHQLFTQSDVSRAMVDEKLGHLADAIERMTYRMSDQNPVNTALMQVAEGQNALIEELRQRGTAGEGGGIDAESRMRLRSIDVQMLRILEEISAGRQETMAELRTDLNALARVLSEQGKPRTLKLQPKIKPGDKEG